MLPLADGVLQVTRGIRGSQPGDVVPRALFWGSLCLYKCRGCGGECQTVPSHDNAAPFQDQALYSLSLHQSIVLNLGLHGPEPLDATSLSQYV